MQYSRTFPLDNLDLQLKISLNFNSNHFSDDYYIDGKLSIVSDGSNTEYSRLHVQGGENIIISPNILEYDLEESKDIEIYIPRNEDIIFNISVPGDSAQEDTVWFGELDRFVTGTQLLSDGEYDSAEFRANVERLQDDQGEAWTLINFVNDLANYVSFERYIDGIIDLVDNHYLVREQRESAFETLLKRLILGNLGKKSYQLKNFAHLSTIASHLSRDFRDTSIDTKNSIRWAIEELDKKQNPEEIIRVVTDFRVVENYPDLLDDRLVLLIASKQSLENDRSEVRRLLTRQFKEDYGEFAQPAYESMKDAIWEAKEDGDRTEKWKKLIGYGAQHVDDREFSFIFAKFLSYIADKEKYSDEYYHIVPTLFHASSELFTDIGHKKDQRCEFQRYHRQGLLLYHSGLYIRSSNVLTQAIEVAVNDSGEYHETNPDWLANPLIYKALADAQATQKDSEEEAVELLETRSDIGESLDSISDEDHQRILSALEGQRFKIQTNILLKNGEYERALETIGRAIGQLKQGDLNRAAENAAQRKEEISAVYNETVANFDKAAEIHGELSRKSKFNNRKQALHQIKADLCRSKQLILEKKYDDAFEKIEKISKNSGGLERESLEIGVLLTLLENYQNGEIDYVAKTFEKLSIEKQRNQRNSPLAIDYDYTESIVVILALQRLRNTSISQTLLDSFLQVSLDRSFVPQQKNDIKEESYLGDVSVDRLWRERLPTPVLNRAESIMCQEVTTAGDYKAPTLLLAELIEFYLALLVEYHGKQKWGNKWRSKLTEASEDEDELSIGILSRIFNKEAAENMSNATELKEVYFSERLGFENMTAMRNQFDHGYEGQVDSSNFKNLKEWVFEFLRLSVEDVPIIIYIRDESGMGLYSARIQWWRGLRQIIVKTDATLNSGSYYYIPSRTILDSLEQVGHVIDEDLFIEVEESRVIDQLTELHEPEEGTV